MRFGNPVHGRVGPPGQPDPASGFVVTQSFGESATDYGPHDGLDIDNGAHGGGDVIAMQAGTVYQAFYDAASGGAGIVRIDHGDGWTTGYAHLTGIAVAVGDQVAEGDRLGELDTTGWATGRHLHYDVTRGNIRQDPMPFLNAPAPAEDGGFWMHTYGGADFDHADKPMTTLAGARFRSDTSTDAGILTEFEAGVAMQPHAIVKGQAVNGDDRWYLTWAYANGKYRLGAFHRSTLIPA